MSPGFDACVGGVRIRGEAPHDCRCLVAVAARKPFDLRGVVGSGRVARYRYSIVVSASENMSTLPERTSFAVQGTRAAPAACRRRRGRRSPCAPAGSLSTAWSASRSVCHSCDAEIVSSEWTSCVAPRATRPAFAAPRPPALRKQAVAVEGFPVEYTRRGLPDGNVAGLRAPVRSCDCSGVRFRSVERNASMLDSSRLSSSTRIRPGDPVACAGEVAVFRASSPLPE